jgi:NDP-sugar pyrophosphorylase family protein
MKAMVLAAGLGTRLRPLTDTRPKALAEVDGHSLLEIALMRLRTLGVDQVIVNVHHFAEQIIQHLDRHNNFGMEITLSHEEVLLDTGGGLKKAAWFFAGYDEPFVLHNVDIVSTFPLDAMLRHHREHGALATLAVQARVNNRPLLFNSQDQLCGYSAPGQPDKRIPGRTCVPQTLQPLAFAGIHVLSPRIFPLLTESGAFSIIPAYLRLAAEGEKVLAFRDDAAHWMDLGTPAALQQAADEPWVRSAFRAPLR